MMTLENIAKDAAARAAKNASVAPELLYAPILWALQDAALATFQPDGERREAIARIEGWIDFLETDAAQKLPLVSVELANGGSLADDLRAILASGLVQDEAGIRDGYVLVPIVPTQEMLDAGYWPCVQRRGAKSVWAAMIAAIRSRAQSEDASRKRGE